MAASDCSLGSCFGGRPRFDVAPSERKILKFYNPDTSDRLRYSLAPASLAVSASELGEKPAANRHISKYLDGEFPDRPWKTTRSAGAGAQSGLNVARH